MMARPVQTPKDEQTYDRFCQVFAGVFKKHFASRISGGFTCYVREGITDYVYADQADRLHMLATNEKESACGNRIAKALLAQGWCEARISAYVEMQQGYVDTADATEPGFESCAEGVASENGFPYNSTQANAWRRGVNYTRWRWLKAGAPCMEHLAEMEEPEEDEEP